ncbi:cytochrome P450 pisatin demethylase [Aspergillus luchuensis]|uniref:Cytochrome P450 pisatin demethylase n=1 Tax=Aspergillus kawachii TaxID=1069201 RepID=A0A146G0Y5_ASPKA|nr:cytochrome P450 pisatin demethylase [Aspergillus luchuensis]
MLAMAAARGLNGIQSSASGMGLGGGREQSWEDQIDDWLGARQTGSNDGDSHFDTRRHGHAECAPAWISALIKLDDVHHSNNAGNAGTSGQLPDDYRALHWPNLQPYSREYVPCEARIVVVFLRIVNRIHRRALEDGGNNNGDAHGDDESDSA